METTTKGTAAERSAKQHRVLYPGREIALEDMGITVTVFPLGVTHMRRFSTQLGSVLAILPSLGIGKSGADKAALGGALMTRLAPFVLANLFDLLVECVRIEPDDVALEDLPHWHLPPIVQAWLEESFGDEKKWQPWAAALKELSSRFPELDTKSILPSGSNDSSLPGTENTTS